MKNHGTQIDSGAFAIHEPYAATNFLRRSSTMKDRSIFGDFQTPSDLATMACSRLIEKGISPELVIEPTCGQGAFLVAASKTWGEAQFIGIEINGNHVADAKRRAAGFQCKFIVGDAFQVDWENLMKGKRTLFLGNPPWVTNSAMSSIGGDNLPEKSNFQDRKGFEAITGSANFDISEWLLLRWLQAARSVPGSCMAMLCKTSVARKILIQAWNEGGTGRASIYRIDAKMHFGVAVDACLLFIEINNAICNECDIYADLHCKTPESILGFKDGRLISDLKGYDSTKWLLADNGTKQEKWRSGIKHDCSSVMELDEIDGRLINGLNEIVDIEQHILYPLLKSSDIAGKNRNRNHRKKWVVVPQRRIGEDTSALQNSAPKGYAYLCKHKHLLDARKSSIYRQRPPFSIFGIGEYSFSPFKVAISGLYKSLNFSLVGRVKERPIMLDDTCYFLPFGDERSAAQCHQELNKASAQTFLKSMIFWDEKRPITSKLLSMIKLDELTNLASQRK